MSRQALVYFIVRRLAALGALLVVISFVVFSLLYISPGNVEDILLGIDPRTPETVDAIREKYHLDEPFLTQYWIWAKEATQLDFGISVQTGVPVTDTIKARLPVSLPLGGLAYLLTMVVGIGLGIASALRRQSAADRGIVAAAVVGLSTPVFVAGVFLLYLFAVVLEWFPVFGRGSGFVDSLWHLTLPALALAIHSAAYIVKHTRAAMINVLDQDYVTFARARGLSSRRILFLYAMRNALIPVVTISGILLAALIVGAVFVEVTFSLPGVGTLLVNAAMTKDLPVLQGVVIFVALVIMGANLLADLAYMAVDPRVRLGRRTT